MFADPAMSIATPARLAVLEQPEDGVCHVSVGQAGRRDAPLEDRGIQVAQLPCRVSIERDDEVGQRVEVFEITRMDEAPGIEITEDVRGSPVDRNRAGQERLD